MSARDEIAKLLFTTDNAGAPDPEHEWEMTTRHNPAHAEYAYIMADALIASGYVKPEQITTIEQMRALARIIMSPESFDDGPASCGPNDVYAARIADAIIAAGWTPPGDAEGAGELPAPTP